jgi:hypothetical protein
MRCPFHRKSSPAQQWVFSSVKCPGTSIAGVSDPIHRMGDKAPFPSQAAEWRVDAGTVNSDATYALAALHLQACPRLSAGGLFWRHPFS